MLLPVKVVLPLIEEGLQLPGLGLAVDAVVEAPDLPLHLGGAGHGGKLQATLLPEIRKKRKSLLLVL